MGETFVADKYLQEATVKVVQAEFDTVNIIYITSDEDETFAFYISFMGDNRRPVIWKDSHSYVILRTKQFPAGFFILVSNYIFAEGPSYVDINKLNKVILALTTVNGSYIANIAIVFEPTKLPSKNYTHITTLKNSSNRRFSIYLINNDENEEVKVQKLSK